MLTITEKGLDLLEKLTHRRGDPRTQMPVEDRWDWAVLDLIDSGEGPWKNERAFLDYFPGKDSIFYQGVKDSVRRLFEGNYIDKKEEN